MIWTSSPKQWPEGVNDDRMYGGYVIDANGVKYGEGFFTMYIDTLTGLVREAECDEHGTVINHENGCVKVKEYTLPAPLRLFGGNGQELVNLVGNDPANGYVVKSPPTVTEMMKWLAEEVKSLVYVCYRGEYDLKNKTGSVVSHHPGEFYVMVSGGNHMMAVPGTHAPDAYTALEKAIERWKNRSPENPFTR